MFSLQHMNTNQRHGAVTHASFSNVLRGFCDRHGTCVSPEPTVTSSRRQLFFFNCSLFKERLFAVIQPFQRWRDMAAIHLSL